MYTVDKLSSKAVYLLSDVFRSYRLNCKPTFDKTTRKYCAKHDAASTSRCFSIFLCGSQKTGQLDLRTEVKRFLNNRLLVEAFLGEDIEDMQDPQKKEKSSLDIEIAAAKRCELILIFLGSPGTISEVTAFGMEPDVKNKVHVFNDENFKDKTTFVNLALNNLLSNSQVSYLKGLTDGSCITDKLLKELDAIVAEKSFHYLIKQKRLHTELTFDEFAVFTTVSVAAPVSYSSLCSLIHLPESRIKGGLAGLFKKELIRLTNAKAYEPQNIAPLKFLSRQCLFDIASARAAYLYSPHRS